MSKNQFHVLSMDEIASRIEYLALAGVFLTVDRSQHEKAWQGAAPGVQSLFETIEGLAADLYERIEIMQRTGKKAA